MMLTADYHTHTTFSHGKGGPGENIEAAISSGLEEIGIADHSVRHLAYGVRNIERYFGELEKAKRLYEGRIVVKTGIELNLLGLDGSVDLPEGYGFDVTILGVHKAALYKNVKSAWALLFGADRKKITGAYLQAIRKNRIDIIAHPGYAAPVDYGMLGKACSDYGTLFEINARHRGLAAQDIAQAASEGARFVISSDAHVPGDVGGVSFALELAAAAGLTEKQIVNVKS